MIRRTLNGRLLLILTTAAVLTGGGVHLLHGSQVKRSAVTLLSRARKAEQKGETDRAAAYMKRYLGFRPGDTKVLAEYGMALSKTARSRDGRMNALLVLEQVLGRDPGNRDIRLEA